MFWALAEGKVDARGLEFRHTLSDIETLNRRALEGAYDLTAISFHAYPYVRERYLLSSAGSSVGDGYGPVLVSRRPMTREDLEGVPVAVAGARTTSCLALNLYAPRARTVEVPFDRIPEEVAKGAVEAGLLIHEAQLTFADAKLHRIADLGAWWKETTGLPLPLGGNAVRRSLDPDVRRTVCSVLRDSVEYGLRHRSDALDHAMKYARGMDRARADRFVGMYVNEYTLDLGPRGRDALNLLLRRGHEAGLLPYPSPPEFAD
ncbi:MAG: ABC transporter substrate-binding protein [Planctomycetes bacterium]|nr:ABC transporter substrate-binding protein [Planctomycetota bacterium]